VFAPADFWCPPVSRLRLTGAPHGETNAQTIILAKGEEVAALAECTGNPHSEAGVKNKKLFERSELFFV
jgi:hypothetical protein